MPLSDAVLERQRYRPLSRRLDRCESSDPSGGNVCLFSAVLCTSQCKSRSLRGNARLSGTPFALWRHVTAENIHTLPTFGALVSLWQYGSLFDRYTRCHADHVYVTS